jgi:hypothetical protein
MVRSEGSEGARGVRRSSARRRQGQPLQYDLTVKTSYGTEAIHTTGNHLFWDLKQWRPASKLKKGEHLKTPGGTLAVADGGTTPKVHDGWMRDLTVPGNNDHDFCVVASAQQDDNVATVSHLGRSCCRGAQLLDDARRLHFAFKRW